MLRGGKYLPALVVLLAVEGKASSDPGVDVRCAQLAETGVSDGHGDEAGNRHGRLVLAVARPSVYDGLVRQVAGKCVAHVLVTGYRGW